MTSFATMKRITTDGPENLKIRPPLKQKTGKAFRRKSGEKPRPHRKLNLGENRLQKLPRSAKLHILDRTRVPRTSKTLKRSLCSSSVSYLRLKVTLNSSKRSIMSLVRSSFGMASSSAESGSSRLKSTDACTDSAAANSSATTMNRAIVTMRQQSVWPTLVKSAVGAQKTAATLYEGGVEYSPTRVKVALIYCY